MTDDEFQERLERYLDRAESDRAANRKYRIGSIFAILISLSSITYNVYSIYQRHQRQEHEVPRGE